MLNRNNGKLKASDLTIEQPLKHRPEVVRVTLPDGRFKVFGDARPFSSAEQVALAGGLVPSTTPRLADHYTDEERAALETAERDFEQARAAMKRLEDKKWRVTRREKGKRPKAVPKLAKRLEEACEVAREAQVELNRLKARTAAAARARLEPPVSKPPSIGQRVAALESASEEPAGG